MEIKGWCILHYLYLFLLTFLLVFINDFQGFHHGKIMENWEMAKSLSRPEKNMKFEKRPKSRENCEI